MKEGRCKRTPEVYEDGGEDVSGPPHLLDEIDDESWWHLLEDRDAVRGLVGECML